MIRPDDLTDVQSIAPGLDRRANLGRLLPDAIRWLINNAGDPIGDELLTVGAAAVALTVPTDALSMVGMVFDSPIRWTVFGRIPTASVGFRAVTGDVIELGGIPALRGFQAIREGAPDATVYLTYFG